MAAVAAPADPVRDNRTARRILIDLHLSLRRHVWLGVILCSFTLPLRGAEDPAQTAAELAAVRETIAAVEAWLAEARSEQPDAERRLADIESALQSLMADRAAAANALAATEAELAELTRSRAAVETQLTQATAAAGEALRSAWLLRDRNPWSVWLNQADPAAAGRMQVYLRRVSTAQQTYLAQYRAALAALQDHDRRLLAEQASLSEHSTTLAAREAELATARAERARILADLESAIADQTARLSRLQADRQALESLLDRLEDLAVPSPSPPSGTPFASRQGQLPWPGDGALLTAFGSPYGDGTLRRQGVVIVAEAGAPVRSVHAGRVVFADWLRGYGLLAIVDHGEGYLSLYGYNQGLAVEPGEWVDAGAMVATAGDSGGQAQSGIYFEIRHQGRPVNPLDWCVPAGR